MNHAVKEEIVANALEAAYCLYVEIDPQPPEWLIKWDYLAGMKIGLIPQIAIGDTVYQGQEWIYYSPLGKGGVEENEKTEFVKTKSEIAILHRKIIRSIDKFKWRSPKTMPIQAADKTFKVVGIEVEWMPRYKTGPNKPLSECDYRDLDEVWFWSYKLEEIE